ncbi:MAG: hypothetical protein JXR23_09930 [Pontiellaceae bacterium]|nr:hypothetical protein [Pontiellaceae bacterium]
MSAEEKHAPLFDFKFQVSGFIPHSPSFSHKALSRAERPAIFPIDFTNKNNRLKKTEGFARG